MNIFSNAFFGDIKLPTNRPFLIAEAGVNHENDINLAYQMIEEAAFAGADAIKFQSYKAERLTSKNSPAYWDLTKEPTKSQYILFQKYDHFEDTDYIALAKKASDLGIYFLCTPFDNHFVDLFENLVPFYKIASADISNTKLIRYCARKNKPLLISTGASTLADIDEAISIAREEGNENIGLLHCILSYPCEPQNANLATIKYLHQVYPNFVIGYSDHVPATGQNNVLSVAWMLGARIIEKHFTLDKSKKGNDHYHSMDPSDLRIYFDQFKYIHSLIGDETKKIFPCEFESHKQARRSLIANRNICKDEVIKQKDIEIKRPGIGIEPKYIDIIVNSKATCDIKEDQVLQWDMFLRR